MGVESINNMGRVEHLVKPSNPAEKTKDLNQGRGQQHHEKNDKKEKPPYQDINNPPHEDGYA